MPKINNQPYVEEEKENSYPSAPDIILGLVNNISYKSTGSCLNNEKRWKSQTASWSDKEATISVQSKPALDRNVVTTEKELLSYIIFFVLFVTWDLQIGWAIYLGLLLGA